jgi:hypothetical protein
MEYFLIVLAAIVLIIGVIGCILPVIPGPPISFIGLLIAEATVFVDFSTQKILILGLVALLVTIMDFIIPVWGTRRFGGTRAGQWGATIGLIAGLFLGPLGIIFGPFVGAVVAELIKGATNHDAFRSGVGSFIGFLLGVGLKLMTSGFMIFYFIKELAIG